MPLEEIVHRVEAKFLDISRLALGADAASEASEELELLRGEHQRDDDQLATLRGQAALVAQRLAENREAVLRLPAQVESSLRRGKSSQAMRQALELDNLRRDVANDESELSRLENIIGCLEFRLRHRDRRMQRLREGADTK